MMNNDEKKMHAQQMPVLTIENNGSYETAAGAKEQAWYELQNAYRSRRILSGILGGIEESGESSIAIVYYKDFRVVIPVDEMMLNLTENEGYGDMKTRQLRILNNMLGCKVDFVILGIDNAAQSVVASRKQAMLMKRNKFFFGENGLSPMVTEGRIVQARVIAVAEKVVRLEIFGVECSVPARNLSWEWIGDAREQFHIGDEVLAQVTSIQCNPETKEVNLEADMKSITKNEVLEKLSRCKVQGRYSGRVTDVHKGAIFIKLDIGVNALAYNCTDHRIPGKHDDVSFVVTRIDQERGVAVGIITRIIRQNI